MTRSARLSRVQEVEQAVSEMIHDIRLRNPDGRLPAETEIAEDLGVSRVTVREALSSLARQGLIHRKQGLGTFVNHNLAGIQARLDCQIELSKLISSAGRQPDIHLLNFERGPVSAEIAERLGMQSNEEALSVQKVFSADGIPAAFVTNVVPLNLLPPDEGSSRLQALQPEAPVYEWLQEHFDQVVSYQIADLEPQLADETIAGHLAYQVGAPILYLEEVGFNLEGRPILYCREYYRPGVIQFQLLRKPT